MDMYVRTPETDVEFSLPMDLEAIDQALGLMRAHCHVKTGNEQKFSLLMSDPRWCSLMLQRALCLHVSFSAGAVRVSGPLASSLGATPVKALARSVASADGGDGRRLLEMKVGRPGSAVGARLAGHRPVRRLLVVRDIRDLPSARAQASNAQGQAAGRGQGGYY